MTEQNKEYLGDGVYVAFDGWHVVLTTENGIETTSEIYLDPGGLERLNGYVARVKADKAPSNPLPDPTADKKGESHE